MKNEHNVTNGKIGRVIADHQLRYPEWNECDLYKLIFQAEMGCEHAVTEEAVVSQWMDQESSEKGSGSKEALLDPISPDGSILRVHLRPFVDRGLSSIELLRAFLETARIHRGSHEGLQNSMRTALVMAQKQEISITAGRLSKYFNEMHKSNFPPVHHSFIYQIRYRPAYRVVAKTTLPANMLIP